MTYTATATTRTLHNYTVSQIHDTPQNHVYSRIRLTKDAYQRINTVREYYRSMGLTADLATARVFCGVYYRANVSKVMVLYREIQRRNR